MTLILYQTANAADEASDTPSQIAQDLMPRPRSWGAAVAAMFNPGKYGQQTCTWEYFLYVPTI